MDTLEEEFSAGVDAYWSGECPEFWDNPKVRERSPFLTGWYMASMSEVQPSYLTDRTGYVLGDDICGDCGEDKDYCVCEDDND